MDRDYNRFKKIVRGRIKRELKRFISSGELIGRQGKKTVKIPIPQIDLPRFRFGDNEDGVGQGEGQPGDEVGQGQPGDEPGEGKAGKDPGEHELEMEVTLDDLAKFLGEELELPNIEDKGKKFVDSQRTRYSGINNVGNESLRHFRRTFFEALKRQISTGEYNPDNPVIVPQRSDKRYRSFKPIQYPEANAVILYIMDVSGSMGEEQKEIVRLETFWIDMWLRTQYKGLDRRYVIHDAAAKEVDEHTFYHTKESGGTLISAAYRLACQILDESYPADEWNIYIFHFSDGDNWSGNDTAECMQLLVHELFPAVNMFAYGQVESRYGSGQFFKDLEKTFGVDHDKLVKSQIKDKEAIMGSIKDFLGKGR